MKESFKTDKISRFIQKSLSDILQFELNDLTKPGIVSITVIKTSPDFSISNVYLSVIAKDKEKILQNLINSKGIIRKKLGIKIGNKVRKIPDLRFFIDNSFDEALKIQKLLNENEEND